MKAPSESARHTERVSQTATHTQTARASGDSVMCECQVSAGLRGCMVETPRNNVFRTFCTLRDRLRVLLCRTCRDKGTTNTAADTRDTLRHTGTR